MKHPGEYKNQEVLILGLARSGQAAARLFHHYGAIVTATDRKTRAECPEADALEDMGIRIVCGGHPEALFHRNVALLVKNPGIPYTAPPVRKAEELGIEVVTEVEAAAHVGQGPIIGITGSNGKTTTTTWIGEMLQRAGMDPIVAGNIGIPLCEAAHNGRNGQWIVAELSSFQLKGTRAFHPKVACLLNIVETHLDYHGTMEDYIASKAKIMENMNESDIIVANADDPQCQTLVSDRRPTVYWFSVKREVEQGVFLRDRSILFRLNGKEHALLDDCGSIGIPGAFNLENAMAASAAALAAGADLTAIGQALKAFRGVEHRLEWVARIRGTDYYNNSKATNATATVKALSAFDRPVVWIAGGLDRGGDFAELAPVIRGAVKRLIAIGQTRRQLADMAAEAGVETEQIDGDQGEAAMNEAVRRAAEAAGEDGIVLLSPSCASWDMYRDYEERGRMFKQAVHKLK